VPETARLLGQRALVEYLEVDGSLYALTLADGLLKLHDLGSANASMELDWLRSALSRLAKGRLDADRGAAARASADASAAALDKLLIEPIRPTIGHSPLLIVPTGWLHAVPWSALPSLRNRPLAVSPSLAIWTAIAQRPGTRRHKTALIAGPRLRHAPREVREIAALRPGSTALLGKEATSKAALKALDGAAIAHLACHGHFRSDSPLFSSLELADGPLNVYELQNLRRTPEIVVLSACVLALSRLHPGDELLGLATSLLGMGTRTIIGSVVLVPDATARRLMLALHRNLLAGKRPALALAQAQSRVATPGFVCLGDG
jgi:CHAT domain-containing protein